MTTLETLKAGDKILISYGWNNLQLSSVEKVGKIHITTKGGAKYNMRGNCVGAGKWSRNFIKPYDEAEWRDYVIELRNKKVIHDLADFKWSTINIELARKIHAMLPKIETPGGDK